MFLLVIWLFKNNSNLKYNYGWKCKISHLKYYLFDLPQISVLNTGHCQVSDSHLNMTTVFSAYPDKTIYLLH